MMAALFALVGAALALALTLLRLFAGPTLHDRALAARSGVLKVVLLCAAIAVVVGQTAWIDAAFAVLLGSLVTAAAVLKFFRARSFQPPLNREDAA